MRETPPFAGLCRTLPRAAVLAAVAAGVSARGGERDSSAGIGEAVTAGGVTVTLREVDYSSLETTLTLDINDDDAVVGPRLTATLEDIASSGLEERPPRFLVSSLLGPHEVRKRLVLGSVLSPDGPVTVEIGTIGLIGGGGDGYRTTGPWVFEFIPGEEGDFPRGVTIDVQREETSPDGISVTVESIHISDAGVRVSYDLRSDNPLFGDRLNWGARLILPNGSWHGSRGMGGREQVQGTAEVQEEVQFPALPPGTETITLMFGPYALTQHGPFELTLDLPSRASDLPQGQSIPLGAETSIAGEVFEFNQITLHEDRFSVSFDNVDPTERSITYDPNAYIFVVDDLGNQYELSTMGGGYDDTPTGGSAAKSFAMGFDRPLDESARSLVLMFSSVRRIVEGPIFEIELP